MPSLDYDAGEEDGKGYLDEHHGQDVGGFRNSGNLHQAVQLIKVGYNGTATMVEDVNDCSTVYSEYRSYRYHGSIVPAEVRNDHSASVDP